MKVLVYVNTEKDSTGKWFVDFCKVLSREKIEYSRIYDADLQKRLSADALFVLGGDGTILHLTEFSVKNSIPIIGINAGKLGFLTEFEISETENAVKLFKNDELKKDFRSTLSVSYNGKSCIALNDAVIQRIYKENENGLVIRLSVEINQNEIDIINGDGVILSTPTGSTAYSLSAGGAILAPGINAFSVTPIAAHSLSKRPIIYSADAVAKISVLRGNNAALFIDGKYFCNVVCGDFVSVKKNDESVVFLRKKEFNFYKRLSIKIKG